MPFTVTMPKLSPTMEEGAIAKWHKKEGEKVLAGDLLVEVATDKATVEYNALDEGYLRKILVPNGTHAIVNQPIAIFTKNATESIEGYVPEGEKPKQEVRSEEKPPLEKGSLAPVKKEAIASSFPMPTFAPEMPLENYHFAFPSSDADKKNPASPLAKKLAKEKGLDLSSVRGSGPGGRITSRDLDLAQPDQIVSFHPRQIPTQIPGSYEEIPLTPMRKIIGERLQQAKTFIPHIYVRQEMDAAPLLAIREQLKVGNLKVTLNDLVIRATALSLREHPEVNGGFDSVKQAIVRFQTIDLSIAVTTEGGLITPIIRHADYKNLGEISVEMKELANRARLGKLQTFEYKGGSFTISNMGMLGITDFAAIINPPQAAILAVGGIEDVARVKNGQVVAGKRMYLTISADHRVLDGAEVAKFLKTLQKYLENPSLLLV